MARKGKAQPLVAPSTRRNFAVSQSGDGIARSAGMGKPVLIGAIFTLERLASKPYVPAGERYRGSIKSFHIIWSDSQSLCHCYTWHAET